VLTNQNAVCSNTERNEKISNHIHVSCARRSTIKLAFKMWILADAWNITHIIVLCRCYYYIIIIHV